MKSNQNDKFSFTIIAVITAFHVVAALIFIAIDYLLLVSSSIPIDAYCMLLLSLIISNLSYMIIQKYNCEDSKKKDSTEEKQCPK